MWEIETAVAATMKLSDLLSKGWEPFAATINEWEVITDYGTAVKVQTERETVYHLRKYTGDK